MRSPANPNRAAAAAARLRYVTDRTPGIRRIPAGRGFRYEKPGGGSVRDAAALRHIRSLVIPPAWREVWICPDPSGHLQATGRDARGRKQYRYHSRWRTIRDETKYHRILDFAAVLPRLRRAAAADLAHRGLPRRKVIAAIIQLLERTLIRVGNDEYAKENHSFGLTTLRDRHARISGSTIRFRFKGKSSRFHDIALNNPQLARIVRRCQELPGRELFQYLDERGQVVDIGSTDVNDYLREVAGQDFTAKDFRTWAGTVLAALALKELKAYTSRTQANRNIIKAIDAVAGLLGNTRSVCRKCYIHPAIVDAYLDQTLVEALETLTTGTARRTSGAPFALSPTESAVLALLQRRLRTNARKSA